MSIQDVSGFGTVVTLIASFTFPTGLSITQFADDSDPLDLAAIDVADKAMGLNGDLIKWAVAKPKPMVLAVIVGSQDDQNLQALLEANTPAVGRSSVGDVIQGTVRYPDGSSVQVVNGAIFNGSFGKSIAGSQRMKTKIYTFAFEQAISS